MRPPPLRTGKFSVCVETKVARAKKMGLDQPDQGLRAELGYSKLESAIPGGKGAGEMCPNGGVCSIET